MTIVKTVPAAILSASKLAAGALNYYVSGRTPPSAYQSMVSLFCVTGGVSNDAMSQLVSLAYPPYDLPDAKGVVGDLRPDNLERITSEIDANGFHVFEQRLPESLCDSLLAFATSAPCVQRGMGGAGVDEVVSRYPRGQPSAVRYDFRAQDVINNPAVQSVMADHAIIAVAQSYLRCKPVIDVMSMWWHTDFSKQPDKDAAQFWHFDMDRIKWLKFFIYLTDVGPDNGPHSFVQGSHRSGGIPRSLLAKGYSRLTDAEVAAQYSTDRIIEFVAPRGTVIAEDTRGLHKGKHLAGGDRLMLQLQFSNSLFGGYYPPSRIGNASDPGLGEMIRQYPHIYSNYIK